ncbi:MAG: Bax inhibitor-1/YccA family protein [Marinifilaceae bacterium]|jgi:uncharacterized YccA/Bax inhibitor family protein|nr:Bax inhibitor-1/YccA family protein [Marinifilaceae bacterium]
MIGKSSNPVLNNKIFNRVGFNTSSNQMSLNGTLNKIAISLVLVIVAAFYSWNLAISSVQVEGGFSGNLPILSIGSAIIGFILALIISFKPHISPILVPFYAIAEGIFLGIISAFAETMYPGIVFKAVVLTFTTMFTMLFLYRTGMIKVTQKFKSIIASAIGGIFLLYIGSWIMGMFGLNTSLIHGNNLFSIGLSLVIVVIAALSLAVDFQFIDDAVKNDSPKFMEWYGAFGLLVTLIWLYIEILKLLMKLASRD